MSGSVTNDLNLVLRSLVDSLAEGGVTLSQGTREFEKQFIASVLRLNEGNVGRSAKALGIHRNTLRNKMSKLNIPSEVRNRKGR